MVSIVQNINSKIQTISIYSSSHYNNNNNNNNKQQSFSSEMDTLTLIFTIIGSILSILIDIYLLILYTHKEQPLFSPISICCKLLILLTLLQVELQPLFLLFDTASSRSSGSSFIILWFVVYFSIAANVTVLKPLLGGIYESDEEDPWWKRIGWAIVEMVIAIAGFGVAVGVGWLFWGKIFIPVQVITIADGEGQIVTGEYVQMVVSFPCFLIGLLCLIGYPILACCGAIGMTALPFSMIKDFNNRPKWRRTNQAKAITQQLKKQTVSLIKQADSLRRAASRQTSGWFSRINRQLDAQISQLQNKVQKHRDFHELFLLQLKMQQVNPFVYIFKLIGAILSLLIVPLWLVQMYSIFYISLLVQLVFNRSVFLDKMLQWLEEQNASFVSVLVIFILTMYMILATLKGIFFVSQYLPFVKIHPMVEGRTWLNSFMFQTNLAVIASTALLHLMVTTFPEYLRGGDIALMMGEILERMLFVGVLLKKKVFVYIFLIMSVLGAFFASFAMFCLNHKTDQMLRMEEIRKKLFRKQKKDRQINIQMTEMNLVDKSKEGGSKKSIKSNKTKQKNKGVKVQQVSKQNPKSSKTKIKLQFM